ncbi:hypothetical protein GpartN1_g1690.t1 [Galdieria partita]|uniref:Major facilitator superfamily (MFS) profile domain-containing protein n=1 Tax=Galdieria partita TaxID=83374 RepID=A0A9C7PSY6_9RHOD|nr:hypothetical protein GpartN1_g1690.t1 [Galdieria partita]
MENTLVANHSVLEDVQEEKLSNVDADVLLEEQWKQQIQEFESQIGGKALSKQLIQPKYYPFILGTLASMTGMLLGLDMSTISGANLFMPEDLELTTKQFSLVSSGAALGAIPGAILLTPINEWIGRKYALVVCCLIFTVGAILEAAAHSYRIMIAGRILVGVGIGLSSTAPVYVSESVKKEIRGKLVVLFQFNITVGEVIGYVVAAIFVNVPGNWGFMLGSSLLWSTLLLLFILFLPESPRWLMKKGKKMESYLVWKRIRSFDNEESITEFFEMENAVSEEKRLAEARPFYWLDIVKVPRSARAFIVANTLAGIVQLDGINSVVYYIGVLFKELGFSAEKSVYMSLVGGGSLMLGTIPAILLLDKWGRRMVGIVPSIVVFFGCIIIGCSFLANNTKTYEGVYIWGLITYELFSGSFQSLPWLTFAEVYPTYLRSFGMTVADAFIYLSAFTVTYNFTGMRNAMTNTGLFVGFYGGISLFGVVFIILFLPELKGKTLEEVDAIFSQPLTEIARQNLDSSINTMRHIFSGRWKKVVE